ncbi:MAG: DUF1698 domain-containing protein [Candidatus Omnitrophota bacterium]
MKRIVKMVFEGIADLWYKAVYLFLSTGVIKLYQPVFGRMEKADSATRNCLDRWTVIGPMLGNDNGSVLDIGCNLGFFSFKAAESGRLAIGVDHNHFNIHFCRAISYVNRVDGSVFVNKNLDLDTLRNLPKFDVIFNFSVFHHWVKSYNSETAQDMMRVLAKKCDRMFFETGQPNETGAKWAEKLHFMGSRPDVWIETFLRDIGFNDVRMIGTFPTGLTNVKRHLFIASK